MVLHCIWSRCLPISNIISLHLEEVTLVIIVRDFFRDALIACLEIVNQF